MFTKRLLEGLSFLKIDVDADGIDRLHRYFIELKKWSSRINLIAKASSDEQIIENHFLDSLTLLPLLDGSGVRLLDVGTGAGFPGLVLKAARPEIGVTLVEPRLKRVSFLRHVVRTLHLPDVTVLACRIEDEEMLPDDAGFSHITSRAVTDVAGFLEMIARFTAPDLRVICMKGPRWQEELAAAGSEPDRIPFVREKVITRALPFSGAERTLIVFSRRNRNIPGKNMAK